MLILSDCYLWVSLYQFWEKHEDSRTHADADGVQFGMGCVCCMFILTAIVFALDHCYTQMPQPVDTSVQLIECESSTDV